MVTLRVSKNILKRLMNIYTHQAAGNYTGSRYMSPTVYVCLPFRVYHFLHFPRRND